jgi:hypothetical protein
LSERTALHLSAEMRRASAHPGLCPDRPTCVVQQVGSYLGYSGRGAEAFGKAARAPPRTCRRLGAGYNAAAIIGML